MRDAKINVSPLISDEIEWWIFMPRWRSWSRVHAFKAWVITIEKDRWSFCSFHSSNKWSTFSNSLFSLNIFISLAKLRFDFEWFSRWANVKNDLGRLSSDRIAIAIAVENLFLSSFSCPSPSFSVQSHWMFVETESKPGHRERQRSL